MKARYISQRRQLVRSFYTGIGKTAVIFPSAFLAAAGAGLVSLGIVFYMRDIFNASGSQIGFLVALWSLCYIAGCMFIRPLFSHILPRYTIVIATSCMCVFTLAICYLDSLIWVYIFYGLYGFATSLFWPLLMGWLSQKVEGIELSKTISKFNFSWSAGIIIGPFLAGYLSERGTELPIYYGSAIFLFTSFMIIGAILSLPRIREDIDTEPSPGSQSPEKGRDTFIRYPAWVGLYTTYVIMGVILNIFPVSARADLFMRKSAIGLLLLSRALFATSGFIILGRTTFWHFKSLPMLLGQISLAILLILMVYTHSPLLLCLILGGIGLLLALSYTYSLFHGASGSTDRPKRMAIHESLLSAGLICGSAIGGVIYQRYSMDAVYWFCSAVVLTGVLIQSGLSLRARKLRS